MSAIAEHQPYPRETIPERGDGALSSRFFILWPLATCIPIIASPRVTLFDVICLVIFLSRPWRAFSGPMITRPLQYSIILFNLVFLISAAINHASVFQTIWRLGSVDLVVIDALVLCNVLANAALPQINQFFFYFCVGICLQIFYPEDTTAFTYPIKFLFNTPLGVIIATICYSLQFPLRVQRFQCAILLAGYALVAALARARNAAAIEFVPAVIYFLPRLHFLQKFNFRAYILSLIGVAAGVYAILTLYYNLAISGFLGQVAKGIAQLQGSFFGGGAGMLLGGRPEVLVLSLGIIASPLIGHGVGNDLKPYENMLVLANIWRPEYLDTPDKTIVHSLLFSAGFEAGIFAMLFWLYVCHLCLRAIIYAVGHRPVAYEIMLILCLQALWNVLFSPLIAAIRLSLLPAFVYGLYAIKQKNRTIRT
jgi:hypothetical protein